MSTQAATMIDQMTNELNEARAMLADSTSPLAQSVQTREYTLAIVPHA